MSQLFASGGHSIAASTSPSNAGGTSSIPGQGTKIPRVLAKKNQNKKQKQYCLKKFIEDF